ncbi:hypothetical protein [Paenibacillus cymbidii]|uniref:hypothetical protein n=1 Tax=Paenibacillus cymbidii TaxID=1639034 RepID=UPI0010820DBD|nr:hypothetical protein [Paenibacillus cymbidii]
MIEQIKEALDKAEIGPWSTVKFIDGKTFEVWQSINNTGICRLVVQPNAEANAHLIANAPMWLNQLVEANERLQWEVEAKDRLIAELTEDRNILQESYDDAEMRAADAIVERNDIQVKNDQLRDDITEAISIWECMQMDDDPANTIEKVIGQLREALSTSETTKGGS